MIVCEREKVFIYLRVAGLFHSQQTKNSLTGNISAKLIYWSLYLSLLRPRVIEVRAVHWSRVIKDSQRSKGGGKSVTGSC